MLPLCWKLRPSWATLQLYRRGPPTGGARSPPGGGPRAPPASAQGGTGGRRGAVVTPTAAVFLRESLWPGGQSAPAGAPQKDRGHRRPAGTAAYAPFTPSHSAKHSPPPSYRDCWHEIGRGILFRPDQHSGRRKRRRISAARRRPNRRLVYDPKAFILLHPRSRLDQACAHCPKFLSAARSAEARFNFGVAVRSLKPAGDHRFGGPLPTPTA